MYLQAAQISGLSDYDRACLVAKYNSLYKKETIDPKIFDRGYDEKQLKYLRKSLGTTLNISCDLEFTKEYKDYPDYNHFNFVFTAYHAYNKSATLPFSGSMSEQPAQIMEIFEVMFQLDMEREEDLRRQSQRTNK